MWHWNQIKLRWGKKSKEKAARVEFTKIEKQYRHF
jgi:hypothetical protein